MSKKIIYLDTETTGVDHNKNGIISVAFIVEIDGVVKEEREFFMCPTGRVISEGALAVNGYTLEQINSFRPWEQVKVDIKNFLDGYVNPYDKKDSFLVIGHNVKFDIDMLSSYFRACGDNYLMSYFNGNIDTGVLLTHLQFLDIIPILKNRKLDTLCEYLGVELDNAHNALADTRATRDCFIKLGGFYGQTQRV